ncbi:hypothetical protein RZS08_16895, partial [Arthrospira platensis SPKY1]|nr:hypothetical protein [Arthrospira platensis SPKY1]
MTNIFWRYCFVCITAVLMISCKEEVVQSEILIEKPSHPEVFGFVLKDFQVVYDTIKRGDNLGKMLMPYSDTPFAVHDIAEKIRDSFDLRK